VNSSAAIARTKLASGNNYRILANDSSGVMSENAALTASRALASDANGQIVHSSVTTTELDFVSGATSSLQSQINSLNSGTKGKIEVVAAATGNVAGTYVTGTITGAGFGALPAQDGVTLTAGQRLLLPAQTSTLENGIYVVTVVGDGGTAFVLTRSTDCDTSAEITDAVVIVAPGGATNANKGYRQSTPNPTLDTDPIVWVLYFSVIYTADGVTLQLVGTTFSIKDSGVTTAKINDLAVTNAKIAASTIDLTTKTTGILPATQGGGLVLISTATASNSATVDFTGLSSAYSQYLVIGQNIKGSTNPNSLIHMRIGTGATPTWVATSTYGYVTQFEYVDLAGALVAGSARGNGIDYIRLASVCGSNANANTNFNLTINNPSQTNGFHTFQCLCNWYYPEAAATYTGKQDAAGTYKSTTAVTAIRFFMDSGNIASGVFKLYGIV
jgi:hypothetical protein